MPTFVPTLNKSSIPMLTLYRYASDSEGTWGVLVADRNWVCHTLEPINVDGARNHALLPGIYPLIMEWSPKFGRNLPTIVARGRSGIRIHEGNIVSETRGCPLVGLLRSRTAVLDSKKAIREVESIAHKHNSIHIIELCDF